MAIGLTPDNGMAIQLLVHFNATHSMHFEKAPSSYEVKKHLSIKEGIPADFITLTMDGRILGDGMTIESTGLAVVVIRAVMAKGLVGGKGGFGAMLRALAKQAGTKKTTDFGACRDLSGRRLRHVNDEKILQKWKEAKDRGEDFDVEEETPTGIEMWYLGTPSWADGIKTDYKKKFLKDRRKSKMCMDWIRARKDRKSPEGAPVWWGCPRGRRCEFAHGEGEIRGAAAEAMGREKTNEKDLIANRKRDAYVGAHGQQEEDNACSNMVLQGMRAQKKARLNKAENDVQNDSLNVMPMTMMGDADFPNYDDFQAAAPAPIQKIVKPLKSQEKTQSAVETASVKSSSATAPASGDIASSTCKWLKTLSGRLILSNEGEVEAESEFATASVGCSITSGKWYYEVELLSAGLLQIGWADQLFRSGSAVLDEDGVGDDEHSWAYDGQRGKKWNGADSDYGLAFDRDAASGSTSNVAMSLSDSDAKAEVVDSESVAPPALDDPKDSSNSKDSTSKHIPWVVGDVVGCLLDITGEGEETVASIGFTLNGVSLGVAYSNIKFASRKSDTSTSSSSSEERSSLGFYPALSLEDGEAVLLNIGQRPFSFRPSDDVMAVKVAAESIASVTVANGESVVVVASIEKKPPAAKRGRKSKKDIAAEKAAEELAVAEAKAEIEAEAARELMRQQSSSSSLLNSRCSSSIPYQPVLLALDIAVRETVPIEGAWDSSTSSSQATTHVSDKGVASVDDMKTKKTVAAIADDDK